MEYQKTVNLIDNKTADYRVSCTTAELQKFKKTHNEITQKQLQMRMIKKYLKKDIYLQKKDRKLLIILILI